MCIEANLEFSLERKSFRITDSAYSTCWNDGSWWVPILNKTTNYNNCPDDKGCASLYSGWVNEL